MFKQVIRAKQCYDDVLLLVFDIYTDTWFTVYWWIVHGLCRDSHPTFCNSFQALQVAVINWLTPWSRVVFGKLIFTLLVKKFPAFYGTWRYITMFKEPTTGPYHQPDASSPSLPPHFLRSLLISSHLCLGFPSCQFPSDFLTKILSISS